MVCVIFGGPVFRQLVNLSVLSKLRRIYWIQNPPLCNPGYTPALIQKRNHCKSWLTKKLCQQAFKKEENFTCHSWMSVMFILNFTIIVSMPAHLANYLLITYSVHRLSMVISFPTINMQSVHKNWLVTFLHRELLNGE